MDDSSSDSSSVTDYFLSLENSSIYDTETCDSLIDGFEQCKVAEKRILSPKNINVQGNSKVTDFASQFLLPNNDNSNKYCFDKSSTMQSFQESSSNNQPTAKTVTCEVGVNTDKSFNYKARNDKQPYLKYKKHLNQYHNFKRSYQTHNGISKNQHKKFNNYKNYNQNYKFNNRWHFKKLRWEEERTVRGFYFFTQLMKCFNGNF